MTITITITKEFSLKDFEFWGPAAANIAKLTDEEINTLDAIMDDSGIFHDETEINDYIAYEDEEWRDILEISDEEWESRF